MVPTGLFLSLKMDNEVISIKIVHTRLLRESLLSGAGNKNESPGNG